MGMEVVCAWRSTHTLMGRKEWKERGGKKRRHSIIMKSFNFNGKDCSRSYLIATIAVYVGLFAHRRSVKSFGLTHRHRMYDELSATEDKQK